MDLKGAACVLGLLLAMIVPAADGRATGPNHDGPPHLGVRFASSPPVETTSRKPIRIDRRDDALELTVQVPYWRAWWFRGLLGLLVAGSFAGAAYLLEHRQRARRRKLEQLVDARTRELAREHRTVVAQARQLARLDDLKSQLFANLSHELRTPLTMALGPLRDLEAEVHGPLSSAVASQVTLARRNAERILVLVEGLLDLARSDAGRLEIRARPFDLVRFLQRQHERFTGLAERRGVDLRFAPEVDGLEIWADPDQLAKVFANLLSNALRHTEAGGKVELLLEAPAPDGTVTAAVRDQGDGIPEAERELIFDPVHRSGAVLSLANAGTGLGLPLARQLVEMHGGSLTVTSEVGAGSVFRVVLNLGREHFTASQLAAEDEALEAESLRSSILEPISDDRPWPSEPTPAETRLDSLLDDRTTVLVVDDHPGIRIFVRALLAQRYRVLEAADGAEGYRMAREALPDLVLTDLMMPEMDGLELTRRLKADPELDYVPVVLLTAKDSHESRLEGLGQGADDYLTKPFDGPELLARIDNLIRQRERLRERFAGDGALPAISLRPRAGLSAGDRELLERVRQVLAEGLGDEDFNVARLAARLAIDRSQLFRRLKEITGSTPSELILETRLTRAAELLARGESGVGEVAAAVGFKSVAHFSERFRRRFGTTPSAWRRGPDRDPQPV